MRSGRSSRRSQHIKARVILKVQIHKFIEDLLHISLPKVFRKIFAL